MKKIISLLVALMLISTLLVGCASTPENGQEALQETGLTESENLQDSAANDVSPQTGADDYGAAGAIVYGDNLSVEAMMTYALQDEYLAYAIYEQILSEYGDVTPFSNIIQAEEYHIELLTTLFGAYGYTLPEDTSASHLPSPRSFEEALATGVVVEQDNIAMYEGFLAADLPDDVRAAFEDLKAASEMHLAAFSRNGGGGGRGNGNGNGNGSGNGGGRNNND